jgi:hypothetical protein
MSDPEFPESSELVDLLEAVADANNIQVLVTGDIHLVDLESAPWAGNIVIDGENCFAIPVGINDSLYWKNR